MVHPGFEQQWRFSGACARHSLRHALLCLTIPSTERKLTRALGKNRITSHFGMDEARIKSALPLFECDAQEIHEAKPILARHRINECLDLGMPVVVCVEHWDHWALIAGRQGKNYIWIDSGDSRVVGRIPWQRLKDWMACKDEDMPYYGIGIRPREDQLLSHSLVHRMNDAVLPLKNKQNRLQWGKNVAALREYFGSKGKIRAAEFFAEEMPAIVAATPASSPRVEDQLARLSCIAELYRLRIPRSRVDEAIVGLSRYLASAS